MRIGKLTVAAMKEKYGTQFTPGNIIDLLCKESRTEWLFYIRSKSDLLCLLDVASGSSGDWAQGVRNIPLTFTFELRDTGSFGFVLPSNQIIPSAEEFMDGLKVMIRELSVMLKKEVAPGKSIL